MRPTRDLRRLLRPAEHRLWLLGNRVGACAVPPSPDDEPVIALATIEVFNLWASFSRHFFLSCALGTRSVTGGRVAPRALRFGTPDDVVDFAVQALNPKARARRRGWNEPAWQRGQTLLDLARHVDLSNQTQIMVALSVPGRALEDLPKVRHFFAHRSAQTAAAVRGIALNYSLPSSLRPAVLVGSRPPGSARSVLFGWLLECQAKIRLLSR